MKVKNPFRLRNFGEMKLTKEPMSDQFSSQGIHTFMKGFEYFREPLQRIKRSRTQKERKDKLSEREATEKYEKALKLRPLGNRLFPLPPLSRVNQRIDRSTRVNPSLLYEHQSHRLISHKSVDLYANLVNDLSSIGTACRG